MNKNDSLIFKDHAVLRMLERGISKDEVIRTIREGEIIEDYKDDYPYPSVLLFKL